MMPGKGGRWEERREEGREGGREGGREDGRVSIRNNYPVTKAHYLPGKQSLQCTRSQSLTTYSPTRSIRLTRSTGGESGTLGGGRDGVLKLDLGGG